MANTVKPLFSDHYLTQRLKETSDGKEDISQKFETLKSFYMEKQEILKNLNESQTEDEWIKPIFSLLGFSYIVQTNLRKSGKVQRPDYGLFLDEKSKGEAYHLREDEAAFYGKVVAIADSKYWERPLSESHKNDPRDSYKNSNPSFQIINYLDGTRIDWGILTNGKVWRLYYRLSASPIQQYYEIDLVEILVNNDLEKFKYFWLFFRKEAFIKDQYNRNFLERVREESTLYAREVGGELKSLVFNQVFASLAGGFLPPFLRENKGDQNTFSSTQVSSFLRGDRGDQTSAIYQATLSFLYKILFLLYAEAKGLLPIDQENYREYSLSKLLQEIAPKVDRKQIFSQTSTQYYDKLLSLFRIIDLGDNSLNVPAYNGGLFKVTGDKISEANRFLLQYKLSDAVLAPVLDQLARIKGEWVDYKFLGVRDLGAIYEGLLEYKLVIEDEATGKVHLENDKGERRETGSYYTPEYIVDYIVQHTLEPILEERSQLFGELMQQIEKLYHDLQDSRKSDKVIQLLRKDLAKLEYQARETLLDIKLCDPAMGSGHFLVTTVDYITRKLVKILDLYPNHNPILEQLECVKQEIISHLTQQGIEINPDKLSPDNLLHRAVMKRCIYGVDLNPMAVELAKVSLWLHSFTVGAPLSFLDHHLRCGNSLIGCMAKDVQNEYLQADQSEGYLPLFQTPFHGLLQSANVMLEIANLSDATFAQVEQSQQYYNSFAEQAKPYKQLLDVYISQYFGLKKKEIDSFFRFRLNDLQGKVNKKDQILIDTARQLYQEKGFFHWDLEFPEVFIDLASANWKENAGFDVVLGNPPYQRIQGIQAKDNQQKKYYDSRFISSTGKYDLSVIFIEKSAKLIREKGRVGFIVPHKFTSSHFGQGIRSYLNQNKLLNTLYSFGVNQIFRDATTYTCLLFLQGQNLDYWYYYETPNFNSDSSLIYQNLLTFNDKELKRIYYISNSSNQGISWILGNVNNQNLLNKLDNNFQKFNDFTLGIFQGVVTGLNDLFILECHHQQESEDYLTLFCPYSLEYIKIEKAILKPFIKGEDICRYCYLDVTRFILYPYHILNNKNTLYTEDELQNLFPLTYTYLLKYKTILENRGTEKMKYEAWYSLWNARNPDKFATAKILTPDICYKGQMTADLSEDLLHADTTYAIVIHPDNKLNIYGILAIINSQLIWFYLTNTGTPLRGGYFRYKTNYLQSIPIPQINFNTPEETRKEAVNQLIETYNHQVVQVSSLSPKINKQDAYSTMIQKHLENNSTDIIHDFLAYLAQKMIDLNQTKQSEIKEFLTWLSREIGAEIDTLTNKTAIKNYLGDYQKQEENLTLDQLLDILKKNRKKLKIDPSSRQFQTLLTREYQTSLNTLLPLKQQLSYTDTLIDQIVYQLYELTPEEIAIIEGKI
jgi:hypothetical protein